MEPPPPPRHQQVVLGDPVEPGGEGAVVGQPVEAPEGVEEGVLGEVGGEFRVAGLPRQIVQERRLVTLDQHLECLQAAGVSCDDQLLVGEVSMNTGARHRPPS